MRESDFFVPRSRLDPPANGAENDGCSEGKADPTPENSPVAPQASGTPERSPPMSKAISAYLEFLRRHDMIDSRESMVLCQVHEDLRLVRGWCNLRIVKGPRVFILGSAAPGFDSVFPGEGHESMDRTQAVVPLSKSVSLSPQLLSNMCFEIRDPASDTPFRCITLAIVDYDTTTAYYRIFNSFDEIVHPQWKTKKAKSGSQPGDGAAEDEIRADSGSESGDLGSDDLD